MDDFSHRGAEHDEELGEMFVVNRRCCFCIPYYGLGSDRTSKVVLNWWARGINGLKKLREWSEIVAGPKWKTFIRRFNRSKSGNRQAKFQYDPLSYALNFEEGPGGQIGNSEDDYDYEFRNFSSRYASISISAKSSVDFGKDSPSFT